MGDYVGLEGVKGGKLKGPSFVKQDITAFKKALDKARVCSTASDEGAITVWIDDDGYYRCDMSRYLRSIVCQRFSTFSEVSKWLRRYLPQIERASSSTAGGAKP